MTGVDLNAPPVICEMAVIAYLKTDEFIKDYVCHFHQDTTAQLPRIVVGFRTGDEHPRGTGICKYIGEIQIRDNIQKRGSDEDTLSLLVRHVQSLFIGVPRRELRSTLTGLISEASDGSLRIYGLELVGDGSRTTVKTTRIHPFRVNLIAGAVT